MGSSQCYGASQGWWGGEQRSHDRDDASADYEESAEFLLGKEEGRAFNEESTAITKQRGMEDRTCSG